MRPDALRVKEQRVTPLSLLDEPGNENEANLNELDQ
jgi:hypothetical protein